MDELKCNPFAARIVELFSENGSGEINFQKFVNIFSVFSPRATQETKMVWAFAIWDFDGEKPRFSSFNKHHGFAQMHVVLKLWTSVHSLTDTVDDQAIIL